MSATVTRPELDAVRATAERAEESAKVAANRELAVYEAVGKLAGDVGRLGGKVDALIDSSRETRVELGRIRGALRDVEGAVRAMRPRIDSVHELETAVGHLESHEARARRRLETFKRWGRRALVGFVIGAATLLGGAAAASALHACGIHLPLPVEIHP